MRGELGELRVGKCMKALDKADEAILVLDPSAPPAEDDKLFLSRIREKGIPASSCSLKRMRQRSAPSRALFRRI